MKRALLMMVALGAGSIGCSSSDACDGLATCLAVTAMAPPGAPVNIDQLIVTLSGQVNGMRTVPNKPQAATLPQTVALEFMPPGNYMGPLGFDITVVATRAGSTVANGSLHGQVTVGSTPMHSVASVQMVAGAPNVNNTSPDMAGSGGSGGSGGGGGGNQISTDMAQPHD
jgi:hypothetical protein